MFVGEPVGGSEAVADLRAGVFRGGAGDGARSRIRLGRRDRDDRGSWLRRTFKAVRPWRRIGGKNCADADDEREREYCTGKFHIASCDLRYSEICAAE